MPSLIGVMDFVEETTADHKSPITSTFVGRMNSMRSTISTLEEVSALNSIAPTSSRCDPSSGGKERKYLLNESAIKIQLGLMLNVFASHPHTNTIFVHSISLSEWMTDDWKVNFPPSPSFFYHLFVWDFRTNPSPYQTSTLSSSHSNDFNWWQFSHSSYFWLWLTALHIEIPFRLICQLNERSQAESRFIIKQLIAKSVKPRWKWR